MHVTDFAALKSASLRGKDARARWFSWIISSLYVGCALELQMESQSLDICILLRLFPLQSSVATVGNRYRFFEFPLDSAIELCQDLKFSGWLRHITLIHWIWLPDASVSFRVGGARGQREAGARG